MIDQHSRVEPWWQVTAIEYMCRVVKYFDDPDEKIEEWKNEAAEGDEAAILFVTKTWESIRTYPVREIESLLLQCKAWKNAHRRTG